MPDPTNAHIASGVTLVIDPATVLDSLLGSGRYDEDGEVPGGPVAHHVVVLAARQLADELRVAVQEEIREQVAARVEEIIAATLEEGVRKTDTWGQPVGEPVTVATLIRQETENFLTAVSGDYNRRETRLQKLLREQVDRAWTKEANAAVAAGKEQVMATLRAKAAEVVADTIGRLR